MNNFYTLFRKSLLWFIIPFAILIGVEILFISLFTGFGPSQFSFLLWDKFHFFLGYFLEEPLETLLFISIDQPLFKIKAALDNPPQVIWRLNYYGYTLFTHIVVAIIASRTINKFTLSKSALQHFPVSGSVLLILSSLFLYLSSCCTAGANWIIHTWVLAIVFNPYTARETILEIYNNYSAWFTWLQYFMAFSGAYLIFIKLKKHSTVQ